MFMISFFVGYWAVLLTALAEQFGTNLRVTVTTNVPNLVRTLVIPMTLGMGLLQPSFGMRYAILGVATLFLLLSLLGALAMDETFGRDLDFVELS
jgi:hypothetical protein